MFSPTGAAFNKPYSQTQGFICDFEVTASFFHYEKQKIEKKLPSGLRRKYVFCIFWNCSWMKFCFCDLHVSPILNLFCNKRHWKISETEAVCAFLCVSKHSSSCSHPGTCSRISVSVCVCLMWCPKWSLRWDIMVRQTYSTTQIKINKQSEVFTLNTFSFFKLCFFNEYTTWPGPQ